MNAFGIVGILYHKYVNLANCPKKWQIVIILLLISLNLLKLIEFSGSNNITQDKLHYISILFTLILGV